MPSLNSPPVTKSQFIVTSTFAPGSRFTKFTGLIDKSDTVTYADGELYRRFHLVGPPTIQEMTLTIPYSPEEHEDIILYKKNNPCARFIVVVQPTECTGLEFVQGSSALYITGCQMTEVKTHEVDRNAVELATIEVKFVADDYYID